MNAGLVQVLAQQDASGTTTYLYGVARIGEEQPTGWAYHLSDALGSVRQLVDDVAQVTLARGYMPYGEMLWSVGEGSSAYGYAGEDWNGYIDLVFLRARYLTPALGAFSTEDTEMANVMQPSSGGEYLYANGNPVNHTDPSGLCVFCEPGDRVKVDARPERLADIYARPDPNSPRVDRVYDEQWVRVSRWPTQGGQDEWQRVLTGNSRSGWILNRKLLDNCDGPPGTFGCLPIARWNSQADWNWGFGPSQFAYNNCHPGLFGGGDCPYNNLRGLHNGLDFVAPRSSTLIWPGTGDGRALFEPNPYPNDAAPNIVIEYGDRRVVFGHVTRNYPCDNHMSEVRSGQTIGESGESNGAHLHFGVRSGETVHYNPLYYFTSALQSQIVRSMGEYYRGFNAYEMISFDAGAVDDLPFAERNFWRLPCPDYRGIVFRHHH